jgi:hypothetical protein
MGAYMLCLGLGLGMLVQVLIVAVQNAVGYEDLGAATASSNFFRSMGTCFGVAIFGAVYANVLPRKLSSIVHGTLPTLKLSSITPSLIRSLPSVVELALRHAIADTVQVIFLMAAPLGLVAFGLSLLLPEIELRKVVRTNQASMDLGGAVEELSSFEEATLAIERSLDAEDTEVVFADLSRRAGSSLAPGAVSLLVWLAHEASPADDDAQGSHEADRGADRAALEEQGLVTVEEGPTLLITPRGLALSRALLAARRSQLDELTALWSPAAHPELDRFLDQVALESLERLASLGSHSTEA